MISAEPLHRCLDRAATDGDERFSDALTGWSRYLSEYVGYSAADLHGADESLGRVGGYATKMGDFFLRQTTFALVCKLLVLEMVGERPGVKPTADYFNSLENGTLFLDVGIRNFPASPAFSWFAEFVDERWNQPIQAALSQIRAILNSGVGGADLISELHMQLFPAPVRRTLGEFYTPRWLVKRILSDAAILDPDANMLIDPSCGTGAFLSELLRQRRERNLSGNVMGLDLNPISVLAAKATYIAEAWGRSVPDYVPILQVDSTCFPVISPSVDGRQSINIGPSTFELSPQGRDGTIVDTKASAVIHATADAEWENSLFATRSISNEFERILVTRQLADSLWLRRLLSESLFDRVVGNPAWVNWTELSEAYRSRIEPALRHYQLLSGKVRVGALKSDVSALSVNAAADHLLRPGGILCFAVTESLFKAEAMRGFRRFRLPSGEPLGVLRVHDLTRLQVFEGASNRTAIILVRKGERTEYPVPYIKWLSSSSSETNGREVRTQAVHARPLTGEDAAWIAGTSEELDALSRLVSATPNIRAREGINTAGGSGIFWVRLVGNSIDGLTEVENDYTAGRFSYPRVGRFKIESSLLYPLVHGRDIHAWRADLGDRLVIVPHTASSGMRAIREGELRSSFPMAYSYLTSPAVQRVLKNRRALLRWGGVTEEWYSLFEIGPYTFAPYKVAYRGEISNRFAATVVSSTTIEGLGERLILPDQTVHFVPCQDEDSAMYLAAIFNSAPVSFFYQAFGYKHPSTFFVAQLRIPPFVSGLHRCVALSRLARQATNEARYRAPDPSLIEHLDYAAGEVLGLSSADVRLSRDSLVSPSSAHRRSMPSASELDRAQVAD